MSFQLNVAVQKLAKYLRFEIFVPQECSVVQLKDDLFWMGP